MIWPVAAPPTSELIAFVRVPNISAISFSPAVRASRSIKKGDRQIYPKLFRFFLLFDWLLETYPKTTTITFHPCHLLFLLVIRVFLFLFFFFFCDLSLPQPNCFLFLSTCSPPHLYNLAPGLFRLASAIFFPPSAYLFYSSPWPSIPFYGELTLLRLHLLCLLSIGQHDTQSLTFCHPRIRGLVPPDTSQTPEEWEKQKGQT